MTAINHSLHQDPTIPHAPADIPELAPNESRSRLMRAFQLITEEMQQAAEPEKRQRAKDLAMGGLILALTEDSQYRPSAEIISFCDGFIDALRTLIVATEVQRRRAVEKQNHAEEVACRSLKRDLEFGLGRSFSNLRSIADLFALTSESSDLVTEMMLLTSGNAERAAKLLPIYRQLSPDEFESTNGQAPGDTILESIAWETIQHVQFLERLSKQFTPHIRNLARRVSAWPVLMAQRDAANQSFRFAVRELDLGKDYPLDTSPSARFRPSNKMGIYLTTLVERLHNFRITYSYWHALAERRGKRDLGVIGRSWREDYEPEPNKEVVAVLKSAVALPPLTKETSDRWSKEAIVPLIMVLDAKTPAKCAEPALQTIWKQKGVKSLATFRSRLLTSVRQTLRSLARTETCGLA